MNHQIEQLKDEITVMDHSLVRTYLRLSLLVRFDFGVCFRSTEIAGTRGKRALYGIAAEICLCLVCFRKKNQVKEHFYHHNVDKDKESLRNEVTKVKKQIASGEHIALHQRSELQKLARIIQEADEERQRQV